MPWNWLKGRFVEYRDRNSASRIGKVVRVTGRTLTVRGWLGQRSRVHLENVRGYYWWKRLRPLAEARE